MQMIENHLNLTTINHFLRGIGIKLESFRPLLHDSVELFSRWKENIINHFHEATTTAKPLFSDFQLILLQTLIVLLFINLILILFYWRKYGKVITDRFIRPSTLKEIEELKLSVARLKLPKDFSPRI